LRSEGPPALLTIGTDGAIVFKDRHHRLLDAPSLTSQSTWRATGTVEPVMQRPFSYDEAWSNIINTGTIDVEVRTAQELTPVWTLESPISLTPGETRTFTASASDPFINAVPPSAGIDFTLLSGSANISLSRDSGASTVITVAATFLGASLDRLEMRAQPLQTSYTVQVTASDATSIADYGPRSFPTDLPWCNPYDAQTILNRAVEMRAQPLPIVEVRFVIANDTKAALILARDLSDRVTIIEPETALNDGFYVENFSHQATGDFDHEVRIGAELVPPDGSVTSGNVFILGSSVSGHRLGSGVLA